LWEKNLENVVGKHFSKKFWEKVFEPKNYKDPQTFAKKHLNCTFLNF